MSSLFTVAESGALRARTRFQNRNFRKGGTINFAQVYPSYVDFVMAGDVFKMSYDMLIRFMPLKAPLLNNVTARIRFGFVPLRLIEDNAELIITGSKDGKYSSDTVIPVFENIWQMFKRCYEKYYSAFSYPDATITDLTQFYIRKNSLMHWLGLDIGRFTFSRVKNDDSSMAGYVVKAYLRFWWDYYRDENLSLASDEDDFTVWSEKFICKMVHSMINASPSSQVIVDEECLPVYRKKDYFTSSLPWQLKGVAPRVDVGSSFNFSADNFVTQYINAYSSTSADTLSHVDRGVLSFYGRQTDNGLLQPMAGGKMNISRDTNSSSTPDLEAMASNFSQFLNAGLSAGSGFTAQQLRDVMAETRIFERLARCGSRYTEYLRSNFGVAPADGTLQRVQYLGGGKLPIITSEIVQVAGAESESGGNLPVGTLRGHGIARGGNRIQTCSFYEFGILIANIDVMPQTVYMKGTNRRLTYKSRWQFFNPSFQHLSEQLIRKGEVQYLDDGRNDEEFGYTEIYNELRVGETRFVADLQDSLSYWSQAIDWSNTRMNLSEAFIKSYDVNNLRPFAVTDSNLALPMVLDSYIHNDSYRPMVRVGTPGMNDHF